jgi:hypothetical protein
MDMHGEASCTIAATPGRVYELVSDVTRMGEWSPECIRCEWIDGHDSPVVGAQFHGTNNNRGFEWTTPNTIVVADPGREFAWVVGTPEFEVCRWRFVFEGSEGATTVTESFKLGDVEVGFAEQVANADEAEREAMIEARRAQLIDGMRHTLEKLKAAAEGE